MEIPTGHGDAIGWGRWRRLQIAETVANFRVSAPCYRLAKNVFLVSVIEPELKFVQIQRQIFLAHVMVRSDHTTLEQTPKRFDALSVNVGADVLASRMPDYLMLATVNRDRVIAFVLVRNDERCVRLGYSANKSGDESGSLRAWKKPKKAN